MIIIFLVIVFLLCINALYVAAEFSSVSVRVSRVKKLAEEGNSLAIRLLPVVEDSRKLDRYVSTSQIGITLSSLILGAYGQAKIAGSLIPLFENLGGLKEVAAHSTAVLSVLVVLSCLQMLFGEFIPKTIALQYSTELALYTVIPMSFSQTLFSWFISLLNGSGVAIMKLIKIPQVGHRHIHSPEEIELLIAESKDGGLLEPDEHERLSQALKFAMRNIKHIMTPRLHMESVNISTPLDDVLKKIASSPYTRLPVYRNTIDDIVGILHVKDVVNRYLKEGKVNSIEGLLKPALFIPETMRADRLLNIFREEHSQQAIVVDEFGGIAGIISLEDLLIELLGDMADEFKESEIKPEILPDGSIRVPGIIRLDDVEGFTRNIWKGEATTVGGYIIECIERIPKTGETVNIKGIEVKIEKVEKNTISSILILPLSREGK